MPGARDAEDCHQEVTMEHSIVGVLVTLGLSLLTAFLLGAEAQPRQVPRIGYLAIGTVASHRSLLDAFKHGLQELGWIEDQTLAIEYRWVEGQVERLPALAAELVRLPVDCLVTTSTPVSQAAKDATTSVRSSWPPAPIRWERA
jgi:putative ABC transport system substrate-binding protein